MKTLNSFLIYTKKYFVAFITLCALCISTSVFAVAKNWDAGGGADTNWSTAANWDNNTLPGSADQVAIAGVYTVTVTSDIGTINKLVLQTSAAGAPTLQINSGGKITISASATVSGVILIGGIIQNNGELIITTSTGASHGVEFRSSSSTTPIASSYSGSGTLTINSTASTTSNCLYFIQNNASPVFSVGGTISLLSYSAIPVISVASGSQAIINGTGSITVGSSGTPVSCGLILVSSNVSATSTLTVENGVTLNIYSTMTSTSNGPIRLLHGTANDKSISLINKGTINIGGTCANGIYSNCTVSTSNPLPSSNFENQGTVNFTGAFSTASAAPFNYGGAGVHNFTNSGTISIGNMTGPASKGFYMTTTRTVNFTNSGTITFESSNATTAAMMSLGDNKTVFNNTGTVTINKGYLGAAGSAAFNNNAGGKLTIAGDGATNAIVATVVTNNGTFEANGTINNGCYVPGTGTISPGGAAGFGKITFFQPATGSPIFSLTGKALMNVNGKTTAGTDYDQITVSTAGASLDVSGATLEVNVGGSYTPGNNDAISLFTGAAARTGNFSAVTLPTNWTMDYLTGTEAKVKFTTTAPYITTISATSISETSALFNANLTNTGGNISSFDRGFCYKTSSNVAITDNKTSESSTSATGAFSKSISSLSPNTQYFYRGYATNSVGTTLSSTEIDFYTLANLPSAPTVNNATTSSLDVSVNVNSNPATTTFAIQETGSSNYVQADGTLGASAFWQTAATWGTKTVTGLTANTSYTFQVKARNGASVETAAGSTASNSTLPVALTVAITSSASSPTSTTPIPLTFTFSENVIGFTSSDVTVVNATLYDFTEVSAKVFTANITPVVGIVTVNIAGSVATDASGNNNNTAATQFSITYELAQTVPVGVATTAVTDITGTTAISGVTYTSDGNSTITASGVIWSLLDNPTTDLLTKTTNGSGSISGLSVGTPYYVRAYATNDKGTTYGNSLPFTTQYSITASLLDANGTATGGGSFTSGTTVTLTATATASGKRFVSWTESGVIVSVNRIITFTATSNRTLVANFGDVHTTYYVRPAGSTKWSNIGAGTDQIITTDNFNLAFLEDNTPNKTATYYFAAGTYAITGIAGMGTQLTSGKIYGGFTGDESSIDLDFRATSDLDLNGIIEPWELTNATVITGRTGFKYAETGTTDGERLIRIDAGGEVNGVTLTDFKYGSFSGAISVGVPGAADDNDGKQGTMKRCIVRKIKSAIGVVQLTNSRSVVDQCLIEDCYGTTTYGAVYFNKYGGTLSNSVIRNNKATTYGGAIYAGSGAAATALKAVVNNCVIYNNTATINGGAIRCDAVGAAYSGIEVVNSTIVNNTTSGVGVASVELINNGLLVNSIVVNDPKDEIRPNNVSNYVASVAYGTATGSTLWPATNMASGKVYADFNFVSPTTVSGYVGVVGDAGFNQTDYNAVHAANFSINIASSIAVTTTAVSSIPSAYQVGGTGTSINTYSSVPTTDITGLTRTGNYTLGAYQYPAPTISSFTSTSAGAGTSVVITGTNFLGATAVSFGGTAAASYTVNSNTQITATVGAGTSGSVSVTTAGGTGTKTGFTFVAATPTITASVTTLSSFGYVYNAGPSTSKNFTVSGTDMTAGITVTPTTNFEISADDNTFNSSAIVIGAAGTIGSTTVYVRLKTGLSVASYNSEVVTLTSTSATEKDVTCSGSVSKATPTLSLASSSVNYNGSAQAATVNKSVAGTVTNVLYNSSSTVPTVVGSYPIIADFAPTDGTNYNSLTGASAGTFSIDKVTLTITAVNKTVYHGTAVNTVTSAGSYIPTGFVNNETASVIGGTATYSTNYTDVMAVGASGITITPIVTSLTATNYSFTPVAGTITINPAQNTVTVTEAIPTNLSGLTTDVSTDLVVASTGTLLVNASPTVNSVTIDAGGVLKVAAPVTVETVILKAGKDANASSTPSVATFSAKIDAKITATSVRFYKTIDDLKWYFMSFPCDVLISEIKKSDGNSLGTLGDTGDWFIKYYDGENRAEKGTGSNWKHIAQQLPDPTKLLANHGYIFGLKSGGDVTLSIPLSTDVLMAESDGRTVPVTAFTGKAAGNHYGWNLVGQPYLSNFNGKGKTSAAYMSFPDGNDATYTSISNGENYYIPPMSAYFVQVGSGTTITFDMLGRQFIKTAVSTDLSDRVQLNFASATGEDKTNLIMDNAQSTVYEIGQDFEKMIGIGTDKPQVYSMLGGINYAYNALPMNSVNSLPIGIYTKTAGTTTISVDATQAPSLSKLLLTDNGTSPATVTDLLISNYTFTAAAGTSNSRFAITAQRVPTENIVETGAGEPTLVINNSKLTINNLDGKASVRVYDALGRMITNKMLINNSLEINLSAKGMFTVQIEVGGKSWVKKVVN